jgi:hypothetical protein
MLWLALLGCPDPADSDDTDAVEGPVRVEQLPFAACGATTPGFDAWEPGGDWDVQYTEDNARFLYTGGGVAVADFDQDGFRDIFLPGATRAQLFWGTADGFEDDASRGGANEALLATFERGVGASLVDFDADGDLDLYHTRLSRPNALLINESGVFTDVAPQWGLADARQSISSSWGDLDGDTDLDLFVANFGFQADDRATPNGLFEARPNAFFERTAELPADFNEAFTFTGGFVDLDGDRLPELYAVNDFGWKFPNQLLWNRGGTFEVDGNAAGLDVVMEGMGLGVNDLNGDGVPDLLMSSWDDIFLMQSVETANGLVWADTADAVGIGPDVDTNRVIAWGADLQDLDNDMDLDALVVNGYLRVSENWPLPAPEEQPESLFVNEGGVFTQQAELWGLTDTGLSRGFVLTDLNGDGALDLVRRSLRGNALLHLGRCTGNALIVELEQSGINRDAVGAVIDVEADGVVQRRWMLAGTTNFGSAGPLEVHVGLGEATEATVTVTWPDGQVDSVDVAAHQRVRIRRVE